MDSVSDRGRFISYIAVLLIGHAISFEFLVGSFPVGERFSDTANPTDLSRARSLSSLARVAAQFGAHHKGGSHV